MQGSSSHSFEKMKKKNKDEYKKTDKSKPKNKKPERKDHWEEAVEYNE